MWRVEGTGLAALQCWLACGTDQFDLSIILSSRQSTHQSCYTQLPIHISVAGPPTLLLGSILLGFYMFTHFQQM